MRKRISLKTRRPDLSRREFRLHYENEHVPLGLQFVDRFRWRRYARSHVVSSTGEPVGFDCYAHFWVDDGFDDRALEAFIRSPAFRVLDEDDRRFLDVSRRMSFDLQESAIRRTGSGDRVAATVAIIWRDAAAGAVGSDAGVARIMEAWDDRVVGATLDCAIDPIPDGAPFDRMLTLDLREAAPASLDASLEPAQGASVLLIERVETPAERLWSEGRDEPGRDDPGVRTGHAS